MNQAMNLNKMGLVSINASEMQTINGGFCLPALTQAGITALVTGLTDKIKTAAATIAAGLPALPSAPSAPTLPTLPGLPTLPFS